MASSTQARESQLQDATKIQPKADTSSRDIDSGVALGNFDLPRIKLSGLQHFLKLRTSARVNDKLSAEIGIDYNAGTQVVIPQAALSYKLDVKGQHLGVIRATSSRVVLRRSWNVDLDKVGFRVDTSAGANFQGQPDFGIDFGDIRPKKLVVAAAAVLLLWGKPLAGSTSFGNLRVTLPLLDTEATGRGEVKAAVQRKDNELALSLKQLNAVMRL